ncbi:MAG: hypothetical protein M3350_11865 [Actinomycetota bacterium]|nr:hypothetical protein [Actinomycetota bacterium]
MGVLHGVVAGVAPEARVIDLNHGIQRLAVNRGDAASTLGLAPGVEIRVRAL